MLLRRLLCASITTVILFLATGCSREATTTSSKPNVIMILLDTLRADHLGYQGYERPTSPVLDQFAKENLAFKYAISTSSWTPVSVASIMTGLYAITHRLVPPTSTRDARKQKMRLGSEFVTIAEVLKEKGYKTWSVTANPWFSNDFGLTQGFETIEARYRKPAADITDLAIGFMNGFDTSKAPFFMYLHYLDPHDPYSPPAPYSTMFKGPLAKSSFKYPEVALANLGKYDGEILYTDTHLGRLFEYLRTKGLYDNTIIVVVADHGEQFLEHGHKRHGYDLHNEEVHVPLIIRTGRAREVGKVFDDVVSTVDIMPTLFELLGVPTPQTLPGLSLLNVAKIKARAGVISEVRRHGWFKQFTRNDGKKIVFSVTQNAEAAAQNDDSVGLNFKIKGVFDVKKDYFEQHSIEDAALAQSLDAGFRGVYQPAVQLRGDISKHTNEEGSVNDDTLRELKSLGYFQ